ncbi:MAG: amicyanin [Xanthobacteraceae bacterium]|nr:MAG: amicyanin [Xanthobacteraceae bacterium]
MRAERIGFAAAPMLALALALTPARAETITVRIDKAAYMPASVSARVGDTIVWTNADIVAHTASARDKTWDFNMPAGKSASLKVGKAGAIEYYCRYHPTMVGRINVAQ